VDFLAFHFLLAFYDKAGHNFVGRSGTNNFDPTRIDMDCNQSDRLIEYKNVLLINKENKK
jgi:hypothetical protein